MKNNAARKPAATRIVLARICTCGHIGSGAHKARCARRFVRNPVAANDTTAYLADRYVAPALPETVAPAEVAPALPCDMAVVVDVVRAGWCTVAKTLSYGLSRAGVAAHRIQAVITEAYRIGLIECVRGRVCLTGLVG